MPLEQVLEDIGPEVSDMGKIVNRRPAGVEADDPGFQRDEILDPAGEGVEEANRHGPASKVPVATKCNPARDSIPSCCSLPDLFI
jgi:hypothetical protein